MGKFDFNIFLVGFMGAGKSSVAAELNKKLGMERLEMDQMIVEKEGMPISEIFEKHGEDYFRDVESQMLLDMQDNKGYIVSCGGGVIVRPENGEYMRRSGHVILLTAKPETIYERVKNSKDRPLLNGNMNVPYIADLMEKRREKYLAVAEIIIETDGKTTTQIADEIIAKLEQ